MSLLTGVHDERPRKRGWPPWRDLGLTSAGELVGSLPQPHIDKPPAGGHAMPWLHQHTSSTSMHSLRPHSPGCHFGAILSLGHEPSPVPTVLAHEHPWSQRWGNVSGASGCCLDSFSGLLEWEVLGCFVYLAEVCLAWLLASSLRLSGQRMWHGKPHWPSWTTMCVADGVPH